MKVDLVCLHFDRKTREFLGDEVIEERTIPDDVWLEMVIQALTGMSSEEVAKEFLRSKGYLPAKDSMKAEM